LTICKWWPIEVVLRGGSWNNNNPDNLRVSYRNNNHPDNRNNNVGFRGVVSAQYSLKESESFQAGIFGFNGTKERV